jgi:hypothetical protein
MKYYTRYNLESWSNIESEYKTIISYPFESVEECLKYAEYLFYKKGHKYVKIVDENGEIYAEYEY